MSITPGESGREPGAVPSGQRAVDAGQSSDAGAGQPTRAEAEARAEQIHADVARTEARRAEEQAARADDAVEEAKRRQEAAHAAEERARSHARDVGSEAQDAVERASRVAGSSMSYRTGRSAGGGEPIVFGPFTAEKPELLVAAAFVGGFILAKIIRGMAS